MVTALRQAASRNALDRAREAWQDRRRGRIEDYLFIGGDRMSARAAAQRLGVSERTITRYRAALRDAAPRTPVPSSTPARGMAPARAVP